MCRQVLNPHLGESLVRKTPSSLLSATFRHHHPSAPVMKSSSTHLHRVVQLPLDSHPFFGILKNEQHVDWKIQKPNFSKRILPSPTESIPDRSVDFPEPSIYPEKHPILQCIRKVHSDFFQPANKIRIKFSEAYIFRYQTNM